MSRHILFERAHRFPKGKDRLDLSGWYYRRDIGAWVDTDDRQCLMVAEG